MKKESKVKIIREFSNSLPEKFINSREFIFKVGRLYVTIYNIETAKKRKETIDAFFDALPQNWKNQNAK